MSNLLNPADCENILKRLSTLLPTSERRWGSMTAQQMLCHVTDQLRMALGELPAETFGTIFHRTILKKLVLMGMPIPKGKVKTIPELDQHLSGTPTTTFDNDRNTLCQTMEKFLIAPEPALVPHAVFGALNKHEWGRLAYIHMDYHFKQFGI